MVANDVQDFNVDSDNINIGNNAGGTIDLTGATNINGGNLTIDAPQTSITSNTINVGNDAGNVIDLTGATNINGGNLTIDAPQTSITSNTINVGNGAGDIVDVTGTTDFNGGSVTISSDLTLATGTNVNEIVDSVTGVDFTTPSDDALVTEAALTAVAGGQAGSGLTYDNVNNEIDLGGDLTSLLLLALTAIVFL